MVASGPSANVPVNTKPSGELFFEIVRYFDHFYDFIIW